MVDLPVITIKKGMPGWKESVPMAVTGGVGSFGAMFSKAVNRLTYDPHGLLQMLHIKLYEQKRAKNRSANVVGKLLNWGSGVNANYIELSGTQLAQVLEMAEVASPEGLKAGAAYLLRHDFAELAYKALREELG